MSPVDWLLSLEQNRGGYQELLARHKGNLALASHELAIYRLKARALHTQPIPNKRELWAAAQEIAARTSWAISIPRPLPLARECQAAGLAVID
jgi:hypothetical protein